MANYATLKAAVNQYINTNGNKEITGAVLNSVLNTMIDSLGANYMLAGVATPSTNPGTPDQNVAYLAFEAGTYTNFNATVLPAGISLLFWNGSWSAQTFFTIDDEPTAGSDNLVKSGGIYNKSDVQRLSQTVDHYGLTFTHGYAISNSGERISSGPGWLSDPISVKEGQRLVVKCYSSPVYGCIAKYNPSTGIYTVIENGVYDEKEYVYTAIEDCSIVISTNNSVASYATIYDTEKILITSATLSSAGNINIKATKYVIVETDGRCSINSPQTSPQTSFYRNVKAGVYGVSLDNEDLRILRFTDMSETVNIKIYSVSEGVYNSQKNRILINKNQGDIYEEYTLSTNTTLPEIYPYNQYYIVKTSAKCSINVINTENAQNSLYKNVGAGVYFVDSTKLGYTIKQFRITDMDSPVNVRIYNVTKEYFDNAFAHNDILELCNQIVTSNTDINVLGVAKRLFVTVNGQCSISYYNGNNVSVPLYLNVPNGTYIIESSSQISKIRVTDVVGTTNVSVFYGSESYSLNYKTNTINGTLIATTAVSSASNFQLADAKKYIRVDISGTASISAIVSQSPYVQKLMYNKVPKGSYGISLWDEHEINVRTLRFTDVNEVVNITICEIDYYEYINLKNAYEVGIKLNTVDVSALSLYPIIQPDQRADSVIKRVINSRVIGRTLSQSLYNFYREGDNGISILKTAKIGNFLYVVLLNHNNEGSVTESITGKLFMRMYKLSFPSMELVLENKLVEYNSTLNFTDGTSYTFPGGNNDYCFYSPQLVNLNGQLHITFTAYMDGVWSEVHGIIDTDTLTFESVDKCKLLNGENEIPFNNTSLASLLHTPFVQQIELATSGYTDDGNGNYYGGCAQTVNTRSYIVKTTDFIKFEIVFTTDDKLCKAQSEATPFYFNYNGTDYLLYAIRLRYATQSYLYLLKIALSNYSIVDIAIIPDCHTEPYIFAYDDDIYLLSGGNGKGVTADRYYYKFTKINQQSLGASEIVADINGDVNVANGGIVIDGLDFYKTTDAYTIAKCQLNNFSKADINTIIDGIIDLSA